MASNREHHARQPRGLWLWIAYWVGMFVVTHVPVVPHGAIAVRHGDKVIHFALYFLLTWLGARYWLAVGRRMSPSVLVTWAVVYTAYAAFDEWTQQFVERSTSMADWLADVAGITAAALALALKRR